MEEVIPSKENPIKVWSVAVWKEFANGKRDTIERASFGTDYVEARKMWDNCKKPKGCRTKVFASISSATNDGSGFLKHVLFVDAFTVREL